MALSLNGHVTYWLGKNISQHALIVPELTMCIIILWKQLILSVEIGMTSKCRAIENVSIYASKFVTLYLESSLLMHGALI